MDPGVLKRLLGAAVLIALAVIFLPMLFTNHAPAGSGAVDVRVPPVPDSALQTRLLQVGPDSARAGSSAVATLHDPDHVATVDLNKATPAPTAVPQPAPAIAPTVPPPSASASAAAAAPAPKAATTRTPPATAPTKPAAPVPTTALPGGPGAAALVAYTVNLGIYADHASANALVAKAKQHGFTAVATPETFQGKAVSRVRVGPFATRAAAEAARLKLQAFEPVASMQVDAAVRDQAGDAPASALAANRPGAWAVQLGAFASEAQATALRDRLRSAGFDGFVDAITTGKSGRLWRVRAGPFATRADAEATRDTIATRLQLAKGTIVTQH